MSTAWNYFNKYKIIDDEDFPEIKYLGGGDYDYSSHSQVLILMSLHYVGIEVPHYMKCEPPKSGKLELIDPELMIVDCNEVIELLKLENIPIEKIDKRKELVECIRGEVQDTIDLLQNIKKWSEQGYYITVNID